MFNYECICTYVCVCACECVWVKNLVWECVYWGIFSSTFLSCGCLFCGSNWFSVPFHDTFQRTSATVTEEKMASQWFYFLLRLPVVTLYEILKFYRSVLWWWGYRLPSTSGFALKSFLSVVVNWSHILLLRKY